MTLLSATCDRWLSALQAPDEPVRRRLETYYGSDPEDLRARLALLGRVLAVFRERFGDRPIRVFRSPGRINLRGMHVDTHGGYLNLMTHHRETVVAVAQAGGGASRFANIDPAFEPIVLNSGSVTAPVLDGSLPWSSLIARLDDEDPHGLPRGHWGRYLLGCALRLRYGAPGREVCALDGVVGSDVPRGAALSSSAALCVAAVSAFAACSGVELDAGERILAARDGEWYAGSRCGVSDQAAMVLGGPQELVNLALFVEKPLAGGRDRLEIDTVRRIPFPDDLRILVVDSRTSRSISGSAYVDYTRNRFAYSIALELLRQEMVRAGYDPEWVRGMDRLSRFSPDYHADFTEPRRVYALLARVPERMGFEDLQRRYELPELERVYEGYFGSLDPGLRPVDFEIRGPLLFALAESERARVFGAALAEGRYRDAGRLMTRGHDGDRRVAVDGSPYRFSVDDEAFAACAAADRPLAECPGAYGASSPVLDALVDTALSAGALGACLTGAGIAGAVLALCRAEDEERVAEALKGRMGRPDYATLAGRSEPLSGEEIAGSVVTNRATAPAGELCLFGAG